MVVVKLVENIDLKDAYNYLQSPSAGAVNVFIGTVRNHSKGRKVIRLLFEAYEPMAVKELQKVAMAAMEKWKLDKVLIIHTVGEKQPGEVVVITGVSSAHRQESFEACEFLIDELKKSVPIWKHEYYIDGSEWINAHP